VNRSEHAFTVDDEGRIIYGLGAVKGLGEGPVSAIAQAREGRPFSHLYDFCQRTDAQKLNRRALEALIRSGSFDSLGEERSVLMSCMNEAIRAAEQQARNESVGIEDLFGGAVPQASDEDVYREARHIRPWDTHTRLQGEKDTLGLYLSGHPIDPYESELSKLASRRLDQLEPSRREQVRAAGLIIQVRTRKMKNGDTGAFVTLDDRTARIEISLFSEAYNQFHSKLVKDALVVVTGEVGEDRFNGGLKMTVRNLQTIDEVRQEKAGCLLIRLRHDGIAKGALERLADALHPRDSSGCPVRVEYTGERACGMLELGQEWRVKPTDELIRRLREHLGPEAVALRYEA
jgi:DNA polymerase-3 subunit alpha